MAQLKQPLNINFKRTKFYFISNKLTLMTSYKVNRSPNHSNLEETMIRNGVVKLHQSFFHKYAEFHVAVTLKALIDLFLRCECSIYVQVWYT